MGKILDTSGIKTILQRLKTWVRSLIYSDTLVITDNNYYKYMKYFGKPVYLSDLCHKEGRRADGESSDPDPGLITIPEELRRTDEEYKAKVFVTSFRNKFDNNIYRVCDMSYLKFPVGTRNIIFATDKVNLHRIRFIPDTLGTGISSNLESWKKFDGYKLNILELPSKGTNASNFPYYEEIDSIPNEDMELINNNQNYLDIINTRNNKFGYSTCSRMVTLESPVETAKTGGWMTFLDKDYIKYRKIEGSSGDTETTYNINRNKDLESFCKSATYNSNSNSDIAISGWYRLDGGMSISDRGDATSQLDNYEVAYGNLSPINYNYNPDDMDRAIINGNPWEQQYGSDSIQLRHGAWTELLLYNGCWRYLTH
jgi:hypothetical protein